MASRPIGSEKRRKKAEKQSMSSERAQNEEVLRTLVDVQRNEQGYLTVFPLLDESQVEEIEVPASVIEDLVAEELKCPVCWGTIERTLTVTTCLHRFCADCLQRSLRVELGGQKTSHDCPSCRAKMASRRDARADMFFDELIQLFCSLSEAHEGSAESLSRSSSLNNNNNTASTSSGKRRRETAGSGDTLVDLDAFRKMHFEKTEMLRKKSKEIAASGKIWEYKPPREEAPPKKAKREKEEEAEIGPRWRPDESLYALTESNELVVKPECSLLLPFLKVPALMQIGDLKQYLYSRMGLTESFYYRLEICIFFDNAEIVLDECLTIGDVLMSFWDKNSEFALKYQFADA